MTRNSEQEEGGIRYFTKPSTLNLGATTAQEGVDLDKVTLEPPITIKLSTEQLQQIVEEQRHPLPHPGCHTSRKVANKHLQEGAIKNIKESRKSNPKIHDNGSINLYPVLYKPNDIKCRLNIFDMNYLQRLNSVSTFKQFYIFLEL